MLTSLRVRNFKLFEQADIELGKAVVLIGPNNSGKTTVLQALALWNIGLRRWNERRRGKASPPEKRPGVTINRRDLISIPVPDAHLLWKDLHVRDAKRVSDGTRNRDKPGTNNVRIETEVHGVTNDRAWICAFEFDYANEESFYCRPLRRGEDASSGRFEVPDEAADVNVAFLPPMSGLAAVEPKWEPGRINVLIGEGQTAQVLRNLCFQLATSDAGRKNWDSMVERMRELFGIELMDPAYVAERGEITMQYQDRSGTKLDLSSSGRGLQQTLLLLAHLYANPRTVLLLDEPDAHLEILRQRQTYTLITRIAEEQGSQVIAASHSEVVLNEASGRDTVIAFVGRPHRIDNGGAQVLKSLRDIGFDQYYQAEQTGWVLYLEGPTDLAILQVFAKRLDHDADSVLERPFVHYVATNLPARAREHFYGLLEAKRDLKGLALFDRIDVELKHDGPLREYSWRKREIENYFCMENVLIQYARSETADDLFGLAERERRETAMRESIYEISEALHKLGKPSPWSDDIKASDEFLDPLFRAYFKNLGIPLTLRKSDYHRLAGFVPASDIDPEIKEKLDQIVEVANLARPAESADG